MQQGSYPIGGRTLADGDTATGVVTSATADIPIQQLATYVLGKLDLTPYLPKTGGVLTGQLTFAAGTTGASSFKVTTGVAPSVPVIGDVWGTADGLVVMDSAGFMVLKRATIADFPLGTQPRLIPPSVIVTYLAGLPYAVTNAGQSFSGVQTFAARSVHGGAYTPPISVAASGTVTINCSTSNVFKVASLTSNQTLAFTNAVDGQTVNIRFVQDATGGRTLTLPSGTRYTGGLATDANSVTWAVFTYEGTSGKWEGTFTPLEAIAP